jgi:EAL domain-containing protein (putative c-di-GMP-specific phosphodiesterase class I)/FixJ family two-component response regulator
MYHDKSRILVIDDDVEIRNVLQEFLSTSHHCMTADSAEEALALLANQPFDLIISDISMAQMSGLELAPRVADIAPEAVIIVISGQRTIEFAIEAMRAGVFDYITKPFELGEVAAAVRRGLDHLKQTRDNVARPAVDGSASANDLRRAIDNGEFAVHYQPKVAIDSRALVGVEALVRWNHPHFGLLPPSDFIKPAEASGLIIELGSLVLRTACAQARRWHDAGLRSIDVAVNISAVQVESGNLFETVVRALNETRLDASHLQLELTESLLMTQAESTVKTLKKLREIGVRISIDDFGTGYSSLSYLKRLPVDFVKLDQSFVSGATTCADDATLVMAIITLAHNLRLRVIAEGVESEEQLAFLRLLRCDEGQGYLFGQPVRPELIRTFVDAKVDAVHPYFQLEGQLCRSTARKTTGSPQAIF